MGNPDQIASRIDLPATAMTLHRSMVAAVELAHVTREIAADHPDLATPAESSPCEPKAKPRSPSNKARRGVVDQVRTALIDLVAEITVHMPESVDTPSPEVATNAVNFLVTGERHKISFSAPQAGTALAAPQPEEHSRRRLRTAAAIIIGIATIVGVFIALMETQGWSF
jgi:hypothetical protein